MSEENNTLINNEEASNENEDAEYKTEENIEVAERPEWLPEKFWTDNGEADYQGLAKSYGELEAFVGKKKEETEAEVITKLEEEAKKGLPEDKDAYIIPDMPEGVEGDNPMMDWWKDYCFGKGLNQEDFNGGIEAFMKLGMTQPNVEAEKAKLGDNVNARLEAVGLWVGKNFPPEQKKAIESMCTTAEGVQAVESFMELQRKNIGSSEVDYQPAGKTRKDLEEMMKDPRYSNPHKRDETYVKQIDEAFKKMFASG